MEIPRPTVVVSRDCSIVLNPNHPAVLRHDPVLDLDRALRLVCAGERCEHPVAIFGVEHLREEVRCGGPFGGRVAGQPLDLRAEVGAARGTEIFDVDGAGQLLDERAKFILGRAFELRDSPDLELAHHLTCDCTQSILLRRRQLARPLVEYAHRSERVSLRRQERHAGEKANAVRDDLGRVITRVCAGVRNEENISMPKSLGAQRVVARQLPHVNAAPRFQPRSLPVDEGNGRRGCVTNSGRQLDEIVESLLTRRIKNAVADERLETRRFGPPTVDRDRHFLHYRHGCARSEAFRVSAPACLRPTPGAAAYAAPTSSSARRASALEAAGFVRRLAEAVARVQVLMCDDLLMTRADECRSAGDLFLGTDVGVFYSPDEGFHWYPIHEGLPNAPAWEIAWSGDALYAAVHGRRLWRAKPYT